MAQLNNRAKTLIGIVLNLFVFVSTIFIMIYNIWFRGAGGPLGDFANGFGSLQMFTNESNLLCAVTALISAIVALRNLKTKINKPHYFLRLFQLMTTTMVALTCVIVIIFLMPTYGAQTGDPLRLISGEMLFTHLITPILAVIVFIFFTPDSTKFTLRDNFLALIPIVVYGIVYLCNVVVLQIWPDFYNFTLGGRVQFIPLVFAIIMAGSFGIARLLIIARRKF